MAGPSEVSGLQPGVLPGAKGGDFSAISQSIGGMMDRLVQVEEFKKQNAMETFERMTKAIEAGMPIDPKAVMKVAKQAGMPMMKGEDMKGAVQAMKSPRGPSEGKSVSATAGSATATGKVQDQNAPAVGAVAKGQQSQKEVQQATIQHWMDRAMKLAQAKGMQQQSLLEYGQKVLDLKNRAAGGDKEAVGTLMQLNEIPFSLDKVHWDTMSPEQRNDAVAIAAGHESPKELNARVQSIYTGFMTTGKFHDPQMAMKAALALAKGGDIPADAQASMTPYTFKELGEQAELGNQIVQLGVAPGSVSTVIKAAQAGGLENALPTALKPLVITQMNEAARHNKAMEGIQGAQLGVEKERLAFEERSKVVEFQLMSAKADSAALSAEAKSDLEYFQSLVQLKKAGANIDEQVLNAAQAKVAKHMGYDVKQVNNWFHWLTGGTHQEFTPRVAPSSSMPGSSGASSTEGQKQEKSDGTIKALKQIMKKAIHPHASDDDGGA